MSIAQIPEIRELLRNGHFPPLTRLAHEGRRLSGGTAAPAGYATNNPGVVIPNDTNGIHSFTVPAGRIWILTEISASADRDCDIVWQIGPSSQANAYTGDNSDSYCIFGPGGGQYRWSWPEGGLILPERMNFASWYRSPTTSGAFCHVRYVGLDITADLHYGAEHTILVQSDSIGWDKTTLGKYLYSFRLADRLRDLGASVRVVNKGFGGAFGAAAVVRANERYYDIPASLAIVQLGTNDAASPVAFPTSSYKGYLTELIKNNWRTANVNRKTIDHLVCGPPSTDDPARTPYIAGYRTAASEVVTELGGAAKGLYYVDLSTAFTAGGGDTAYFSETSIPRVHPNDAGHGKHYEVMAAALNNSRFVVGLGLAGQLI